MSGLFERLLHKLAGRPRRRRRSTEPSRPERTYPINLVGEQHCADAVARCRRGDAALIWHEADNPDDAWALAVTNADGELLGYVPRDSFLQRMIHEEQRGCRAWIRSVGPGVRGFDEMRIDVVLDHSEIGRRSYAGGG